MPEGYYGAADATLLRAFCECEELRDKMRRQIDKFGPVDDLGKHRAITRVFNDQTRNLVALSRQLGLSTNARLHLKLPVERKKSKFDGLIKYPG